MCARATGRVAVFCSMPEAKASGVRQAQTVHWTVCVRAHSPGFNRLTAVEASPFTYAEHGNPPCRPLTTVAWGRKAKPLTAVFGVKRKNRHRRCRAEGVGYPSAVGKGGAVGHPRGRRRGTRRQTGTRRPRPRANVEMRIQGPDEHQGLATASAQEEAIAITLPRGPATGG